MTTERKPHGYYTDKVFTPADMDKAIAAEREACAKVADAYHIPMCNTAADAIAAAIRARGEA